MKSTQRKMVIKHSVSSDISFPAVVNMKRNLTYIKSQVHIGITKLQANMKRVRQFKTDSRAKLSPISLSEPFVQKVFLKLSSFDSLKKAYQ